MEKAYYVTTPIYYVNSNPHLGHSYATILADVIARYQRLRGNEVMFLTGTDEHGQKLEDAARSQGKEPQDFVDEVVKTFKDAWRKLNISNDDFIRTTEPRHERVVKWIFQKLHDQNDIYLDRYEGWYCTPCESFWTETDLLEEHKCPECRRETSRVHEKSYFFRMSKYQDAIIKFYEDNPDFIIPEAKRTEVLNRLHQGIQDISVSRTTVRWGVPVPFDDSHTIYVWFDALINYLSAIGFPDTDDKFTRFWPADVHVIGKDILWFHGVIWPCMLLALGIPPPQHLCVTGFWLQGEDKMSKSKGNVTDPVKISEEFGVDALRYFLMREMSLGQDARFSISGVVSRLNSDLANDYGNLLHRTLKQVHKFTGGRIPAADGDSLVHASLVETARDAADQMEDLQFKGALETVWTFIRSMNKYIDEKKPWELARTDEAAMECVLTTVLEAVRSAAIITYPILPNTTRGIFNQLSLPWDEKKLRWDDAIRWGEIQGKITTKAQPIFPRVDLNRQD
ncbi:MAG: methionine--tRNA ligase [bacterium]